MPKVTTFVFLKEINTVSTSSSIAVNPDLVILLRSGFEKDTTLVYFSEDGYIKVEGKISDIAAQLSKAYG